MEIPNMFFKALVDELYVTQFPLFRSVYKVGECNSPAYLEMCFEQVINKLLTL